MLNAVQYGVYVEKPRQRMERNIKMEYKFPTSIFMLFRIIEFSCFFFCLPFFPAFFSSFQLKLNNKYTHIDARVLGASVRGHRHISMTS